MVRVGTLQQDMILCLKTLKKIGLVPVEVCSPGDESWSQLQAAPARKLQMYAPLLIANLQYNLTWLILADGWQVEILILNNSLVDNNRCP